MADDELFKRYLEIGASILGMSRERAEGIVRDLVASGEVARTQATKAADWLVERGRAGTEELSEMIRREIRQQVTALGLATKDDVARLEAQLQELRATPAGPAKAAGKATRVAKATKAGNPAGITRAASVRKRSGGAPPAGGTGRSGGSVRPKG